jgi:hypothetical protein
MATSQEREGGSTRGFGPISRLVGREIWAFKDMQLVENCAKIAANVVRAYIVFLDYFQRFSDQI